jgi:hypothetical protein
LTFDPDKLGIRNAGLWKQIGEEQEKLESAANLRKRSEQDSGKSID